MLIINVSAATVAFHEMPQHLTQGVTLCLLTSAVAPLVLLLMRSELFAPWCADAFIASLFANHAAESNATAAAAPRNLRGR